MHHRGEGCQASFPNWQRGVGLATSTTAVPTASMAMAASAAATLSSVEEYLSMEESPGLDSGCCKDASDDSGYCVVVQRCNPSLTRLWSRGCYWMLDKLAKRSFEDNVQLSLLYYKKFVKCLTKQGYRIYPYDGCVANKVFKVKQVTICFHIDDCKISHKSSAVVDDTIDWL
jgi:hypothetical protein